MGFGASKQQTQLVEPMPTIVKNSSHGKLFHGDQNGTSEEIVEEKVLKLTSLQKQLIVDSWNNIEDKTKFGQMVLKRLFNLNIGLKNLYHLENVPDEQYAQTLKFMSKADHITTLIESIVAMLIKNKTAILKSAKVFGTEHIKPRLESHADAQYWEMLKDSILEEVEGEQKNLGAQYSETKMSKNINDAWNIMMSEVINIAKQSYEEARRKLSNMKKTLMPTAAQVARKITSRSIEP